MFLLFSFEFCTRRYSGKRRRHSRANLLFSFEFCIRQKVQAAYCQYKDLLFSFEFCYTTDSYTLVDAAIRTTLPGTSLLFSFEFCMLYGKLCLSIATPSCDLLFSFEFCSWYLQGRGGETHSLAIFFWILLTTTMTRMSSTRETACYFLLNFVRRCTRRRKRHGSGSSLLFSFEFCSKLFKFIRCQLRSSTQSCYFLLNFVQPVSISVVFQDFYLAIFFWILCQVSQEADTLQAKKCELAIFFWILFNGSKKKEGWTAGSRLAIFFWILYWGSWTDYLPPYLRVKVLLFSFEFCFHDAAQHLYSLSLARLAIFFWILYISYRRLDKPRKIVIACYFLLNFVKSKRTWAREVHHRQHRLAIFFWILSTRGHPRTCPPLPTGTCYFLLNFVIFTVTMAFAPLRSLALAIFFWILCVSGNTVTVKVYYYDYLLFSFEFCCTWWCAQGNTVSWSFLAIFFWILLIIYRQRCLMFLRS